jgi:tetratricopeptide (TPR) repeat protein
MTSKIQNPKSKIARATGTLLLVVVIACPAVSYAQSAPDEAVKPLEVGHDLLRQWRVEEAEAVASDLLKRFPSEPSVLFLAGMVRLHQGRYADADVLVQRAAHDQTLPPQIKETVAMVHAVANLFATFHEAKSKHFILRYTKLKDAVLVEDALATLEKAYANVGADLKCFPPSAIIVEVYPDADSFCTASTLQKKDVERSGAIAICHFNRIMITSPRSLIRGYPWLDTLCHEYVHYVVIKKSKNSVPVWLHEGIAKYEESRWRSAAGGEMNPVLQTILAQALEQNQLVGFERMHPTLAKLDFREAQTAYAEMESLVDFVLKTGGPGALPGILDRAGDGEPIEDAVAHGMKMPFEKFLAAWNTYMQKMRLKKIPGLQILRPKLAGPAGNLGNDAGFEGSENKDAVNLALLGDMLRDELLWEAAVIEYEKALQLAGLVSPQIMNKVAQALTRDEKLQRAESLLNTIKETYPDYVATYASLGALYIAQKKFDLAAQSLRKALEINPFDPYVRHDLIAVYSRLSLKAEADREMEKLRIVMGEVVTGEKKNLATEAQRHRE